MDAASDFPFPESGGEMKCLRVFQGSICIRHPLRTSHLDPQVVLKAGLL